MGDIRSRRTLKAGVIAALSCAAFSVLLLLTVGGRDSRMVAVRATVGRSRVVSQPGSNGPVPSIAWPGNSTVLVLAIGASALITAIIAAWAYRSAGRDVENRHHQTRRVITDVSHDLRGPLIAMRLDIEEALRNPAEFDLQRTGRALLAGVDRLQAIVTDLLTTARLDAHAPANCEVTDLARLVGTELDRRTCRMRIVRDLQPNVHVDCHRLQIIRLLANLLDNAERHATEQITVIVRTDASMATLEVIDDGEGVPAEYQELVFDRFTRLDSARNRDSGGTGLGLAIARQIAETHEGTLGIYDSMRGARVVLRIPAHAHLPEH